MKNKTIFTAFTTLLLSIVLIACGGNSEQNSDTSEEIETPAPQQQTISPAETPEKLNLNTATEEEFLAIPGVGERMVHEFEEYRPYISINQFRKEIGKYVDEEQVAAYEEFVYVPIDPNECDAATLQQIPGVNASEAEQLISARPFESSEAFLEQVSEYVNDDQRATAERFLTSE